MKKFLWLPALLGAFVGSAFGDEAVDHYNSAIKRAKANDLRGAIAEYSKAIELKPDYADAYVARGVAKRGLKDTSGAIADYTRAIEIKPDDALAYYNRGIAREAKSDSKGALADYTRAIELEPNDADAYYRRGKIKESQKDLKGAMADYTRVVELKPDSVGAYYQRGKVRETVKDFDGALLDYGKAIGLDPAYSLGYLGRGFVRHTKGDYDGAIKDFTRAIELKPEWPLEMAYNGRGNAKARLGDADAIADYSKAIELNSNYDLAYYNRGLMRERMADLGAALADYTAALKFKPDWVEPYANLASVKRSMGDWDGALADARKAIELQPDYPQANMLLGLIHYERHEFAEARKYFRKLFDADASDEEWHFRLWLSQARLGQETAATQELRAHLERRKARSADDWELKVGRFLAGQSSEADLLQAAAAGRKAANVVNSADGQKKAAQRESQAYFYAGSKRLIQGDEKTATAYFNNCLKLGSRLITEYDSATAELKFLKAGN